MRLGDLCERRLLPLPLRLVGIQRKKTSEEGINTGIAIMNLTGETVTLDLELVDPDGNVLATAKLDGENALAPNGHLSLFVDQIPWSTQIDFSDFMGLIRVTPSGKIAATVVQTRPGQFATMPVAPQLLTISRMCAFLDHVPVG